MRNFYLFLLWLPLAAGAQNDYVIKPLPFTSISLTDEFWKSKMQVNKETIIPFCFGKCEETGRVKNFSIAAKIISGEFCTAYAFDDTDVYKTIEAASYSLQLFPDHELSNYLDSLIAIIAKAQEPDGYLYTPRTINPNGGSQFWRMGAARWVKEREHSHELYNAGHLYEAAATHYWATGKRNLLDVAIKNANLIDEVFGPTKMHTIPGHQVIEMGLVKLFRITHDARYLALAKFFLEERGKFNYPGQTSPDGYQNGEYWQDHVPVVSQREAVGHAVRAGYMYAGMADVAAMTSDKKLTEAIDSIWINVVGKKMYLTGGVGAAGDGERFGRNYELPNATAYAETCAAIAQVFWNHRMFMLHGESKYYDVLERVLYNGLISGVAMDGKSFFYSNAMEVMHANKQAEPERIRSGWFSCACCPPNVARLLASVSSYVYAQSQSDIYVNLYASSTAIVKTPKGEVKISQESEYPWDGNIKVKMEKTLRDRFRILLRIPGWATGQAMPSALYSFSTSHAAKPVLAVNGVSTPLKMEKGYAVLDRVWKNGDVIELKLSMTAQRVVANKNVKDAVGKVALQRGPIVYCAEWADNAGRASNFILPDNTIITEKKDNSFVWLEVNVPHVEIADNSATTVTKKLKAIPYYFWANRGEGEMRVWIPTRIGSLSIEP
jgi:DUF1680 family protein